MVLPYCLIKSRQLQANSYLLIIPVSYTHLDAVFAENGVDYTSDPDNVIFTLADGKTKLTVPRTKILSVKFKDGCDTVSYTHLDVYKRQEVDIPIETSDPSMDRRHCIINVKRNKQGEVIYTCLLYTSVPNLWQRPW